MPLFKVVRKSDGFEVYRYEASEPIEWSGMPFSLYDHIEVVEEQEPQQPTYNGSWVITKLALRNRFTLQEKAAVELASVDNPNASQEERERAAIIRAFLDDLRAAESVNLKSTATIIGVTFLETQGIISEGRAAEILTTPPSEEEIYRG